MKELVKEGSRVKVLNFGSLNIDYTYQVDHFVRAGETMSSESLQVFSGGKGLNQSIALSKAGADVWHAGAVGAGDGDFLIEQMKKAGVHTELIEHLDGQTGHAIIQKDPAGQNCILLYGGANQRITREMVDRVLTQFEADDFLILQNEISEIGYIMEKAHEKGMKIVLNPSPMNAKILSYPLEYVDYFLLNEVEASDICGIEATKDPQALMNGLVKQFPEAKIVLTLGGDGSVYRDGDTVLRQGIYKVPVVDTTAAGDTFTGYFIASAVKGNSVPDALLKAAKAAAITVMGKGAAPSIPWDKQVEEARL